MANPESGNSCFHCAHLDGTTGVQCLYQGPYRYQPRGRPSLAMSASGDAEVFGETVYHHPFLICQPAERFRDFGQIKSEDVDTYNNLVEEQKECSKFEAR